MTWKSKHRKFNSKDTKTRKTKTEIRKENSFTYEYVRNVNLH